MYMKNTRNAKLKKTNYMAVVKNMGQQLVAVSCKKTEQQTEKKAAELTQPSPAQQQNRT